eukprot:m.192501 g.192501  ORF g.192501 m.192501 type:complete len:1091 (+) comp14856_c0_seq1:34-3306(+)
MSSSHWLYKTVQKSTCTNYSLCGAFTAPDHLNLIISQYSHIQIFKATPDGLEPVKDVDVYGRIAHMAIVSIEGQAQDSLFVLTEDFKYFLLEFNVDTAQIRTVWSGDAGSTVARPAQTGMLVAVDAAHSTIALRIYPGLLKIIQFDAHGPSDYDTRLEELSAYDIAFLNGTDVPTLAVLHHDSIRQLSVYRLLDSELTPHSNFDTTVDDNACCIVPLPRSGSFLVLGSTLVHLDQSGRATVDASPIDGIQAVHLIKSARRGPMRVLIGDQRGGLHLLVVDTSGPSPTFDVKSLGETSSASAIAYIDNNVVFVGSETGDSKLLQLVENPLPDGKSFIEQASYENIGSILDFDVVKLGGTNQAQLFMGSGAFQDGSFRVVKSGVSIDTAAEVDMPQLKTLSTLYRPTDASAEAKQTVLHLSFLDSTSFLSVADGELEGLEVPGAPTESTLLACNISDTTWLFVSATAVSLINATTFEVISQWSPSNGMEIGRCSRSGSQVVVAGGNNLILLSVSESEVTELRSQQLGDEIAAIDNTSLVASADSEFILVALWQEMALVVLRSEDFSEVFREQVGKVVATSVCLVTLDDVHYALYGRGDGVLHHFRIDGSTGELRNGQFAVLGTEPIHLTHMTTANGPSVFAACDRPAVVYSSIRRLLCATVSTPHIRAATTIDTAGFENSVVYATPDTLAIGVMDSAQKLQITTEPLQQSPAHLAYSAEAKAVLVGVQEDFVSMTGCLKLLDQQTHDVLSVINLEQGESVGPIESILFADTNTELFVVGTAYVDVDEDEPTKGRLLLYSVSQEDRKLKLVAWTQTKGAVYSIAPFQGHFVAGINSALNFYKKEVTAGGVELSVVAGHFGYIVVYQIDTRDNVVLVGDLMRSVTLLSYTDTPVPKFTVLGQNETFLWTQACALVDTDTAIVADNAYNLSVVKRNLDAPTPEERKTLQTVAQFHLGEIVNDIKPGVLGTPTTPDATPVCFLCSTTTGAIGALIQLTKDEHRLLVETQVRLSQVIHGVGGLEHATFRSFKSDKMIPVEEAQNIVDGDLVEMLLHLDEPTIAQVVRNFQIPTDSGVMRDVTSDELQQLIQNVIAIA